MEKSFYLFDQDFNETSDPISTVYIVIIDSDRAILDGELNNMWSSSSKEELRNIGTDRSYYQWNYEEEVYMSILSSWEENLISKLNDLTESLLTPTDRMVFTSENAIKPENIFPFHKFRLTFELVDGTTFTVNRASEDIRDLCEIASHLSKEGHFKGQIKSVHIE